MFIDGTNFKVKGDINTQIINVFRFIFYVYFISILNE